MLEDRARADEALWFLNGRLTVRRSAADGPDRVSVTEQLMAQGDSPPLHLHHREDEVFHVLEGCMRFRVGEAEVVAHPGETLLAPKGVPHSFRIESPRARFVTITVGGDFEAMVREVSRPAGEDLPEMSAPSEAMKAALTAACQRNHIRLVGPPLTA